MTITTGQVSTDSQVIGVLEAAGDPFVGLTTVPLARDALAACALLVGLALYWSDLTRGVDHPIVVVATIVGLCGIALPYLTRARVLELPWTQDPYMRVWFLLPLVACCVADLATDAIPGGSWGIGAGMALSLTGAILGIWPRWRFPAAVLSLLLLGLTFASPLVAAVTGEFTWQVILSTVLASGFIALIWWLSAGQFLRGDPSAGVFLLGLGLSMGLAMAILGGSTQQPWVESVPNALPGLMLLPAVAAAAAPQVVRAYREQSGGGVDGAVAAAENRTHLWTAVVGKCLLAATAYGVLVVVQGAIAASANWEPRFGALRLGSGLALAAVAYWCFRAFGLDRSKGYRAVVFGALAISLLGLLAVVARSVAALPPSIEMLASLALPGVILCALLVPTCFAGLRRDLLTRKIPVIEPENPSAAVAVTETPHTGRNAGVSLTPVAPPVETAAAELTPSGLVSSGGVAESVPNTPKNPRLPRRTRAGVGTGTGSHGTQVVAPQVVAVLDEPDAELFDQNQVANQNQIDPAMLTGPVLTGPRWTPQQAADPMTPLTDLQRIAREAPHLRPLVAANPVTYPGLLDWLAQLDDPDVDLALQRRG